MYYLKFFNQPDADLKIMPAIPHHPSHYPSHYPSPYNRHIYRKLRKVVRGVRVKSPKNFFYKKHNNKGKAIDIRQTYIETNIKRVNRNVMNTYFFIPL